MSKPTEDRRKAAIEATVKGGMDHYRKQGASHVSEDKVRREVIKAAETADRRQKWQ